MKKIFLIMFMLSSFVFADKILKANLGGSCETVIRVNNGYVDCHSVFVKWNLTKGRITTRGNTDDENEKFLIRIWDKNNQRIDDVAANIQVNKALAGEEYKIYNENLKDAVELDIVPLNENFSPYKLEIKCNNNSVRPYRLKNNDKQFYCNSTPYENCPNGFHIADNNFDDDEYFDSYTCEKNKICSKGERYDVVNNVCVSPDSGYIWLNNDKNDLRQRPTCKAENERYNENTNECEYKIENSHWIGKSLEYECNEGYVYINGLCEEKDSCNAYERYDEENNSCIIKPENSHWNQDNEIIWICDSGYVKINESCEVKRVCNENQKYIEVANWCENPPANGAWNDNGDVVCNEGYVKLGLLCVQKAICEHWNSENNTCFEKPVHSHWVYSEGATWECDNGFFETEYGCVENKKCGFFERYNSYTNECVDKPLNSHWTEDNGTNWVCDDGYYNYLDKCEEINPVDLTNYISFAHDLSFGFGAGFGKDQQDNSTPIVNVEAYYNIGAKIGSNEFFNIRTQLSIGLLYTGFEYSSDYHYIDDVETVNSIAFTFGPNIGFDFWKFSFDYSYVLRYGESLESVTFNNAYSKYKFGFNINEHFNVNVSMISNMISSTSVLNEFDDYMFSIGLTYRF